jgi:hypothetical protein
MLLDILPAVGSKAAVDYIKALLVDKKLAVSDRVTQLFSTVALIAKADMELVDTVRVSQTLDPEARLQPLPFHKILI